MTEVRGRILQALENLQVRGSGLWKNPQDFVRGLEGFRLVRPVLGRNCSEGWTFQEKTFQRLEEIEGFFPKVGKNGPPFSRRWKDFFQGLEAG